MHRGYNSTVRIGKKVVDVMNKKKGVVSIVMIILYLVVRSCLMIGALPPVLRYFFSCWATPYHSCCYIQLQFEIIIILFIIIKIILYYISDYYGVGERLNEQHTPLATPYHNEYFIMKQL